MLVLYAVMCALFIKYPSIFFKVSEIVAAKPEKNPDPAIEVSWTTLKTRITDEKLYLIEGLTIEQLSSTLSVSKHSLSKLVNSCEGVNFNTFIGRLRVGEAQAIIKAHPEMPLADVAMAAGYSEHSNFSRQFKTITGFTPGEYRQRIGMGDFFAK